MNTVSRRIGFGREARGYQRSLRVVIALLIFAKTAFLVFAVSGGNDLPVPEVRSAAAQQGSAAPVEPAAANPDEPLGEGATDTPEESANPVDTKMRADVLQTFDGQVNLLLEIENKRAALRAEEEALAQRAHSLLQLKADIEGRLAELEKVRGELLALVEKRQSEEDRKLLHLVKVYESMRPEQAAPLIDGLDDDLVVQILSRMREKQAAKILEYVDPARGISISRQIAPRQDP